MKWYEKKEICLPEGFSVGFASATVNPPLGISMAGYGVANAKERFSTENRDELKLIATAISDGEDAVLLYTFDCSCIAICLEKPMFALLEEEVGIPEDHLIFQATHTHAGPVMYSRHEAFRKVGEYLDTVFHPALVKVAKDALADLTPAKAYGGKGRTEKLNYVRRYISREDGSFLGNWPEPGLDPSSVMHEGEPDEQMQVLRFEREGKKDVVLINWQCHPTSSGGYKKTFICSDWVGVLRRSMEAQDGVLCAYHQGAAGNLIPYSALAGEKGFDRDAYLEHGELLAEKAREILKNAMVPLKTGRLRVTKNNLPLVGKKGDERITPLTAVSCGDFAFATTPNESFCQNGIQLKAGSPCPVTFFCELTNEDCGYLPAAQCFDNGGYEVRITPYQKGAGEQIVETLLGMLFEQKALD